MAQEASKAGPHPNLAKAAAGQQLRRLEVGKTAALQKHLNAGFAKVPGFDAGYRLMTRVLPLGRGVLFERGGTVFVR